MKRNKRGQNRSFSLCNFLPENCRSYGTIFQKKNRKGSHVGMILSFVIFIGFLFFVFTILQPKLNFSSNKQDSLDYLELELIKNVSANFSIANININDAVNPNFNCIQIQGFLIWTEFATPLVVVKNANNRKQDAYTKDFSRGIGDLIINRENKGDKFFKIYHSPKFENLSDTGMECKPIGQGDYTVGLIKVSSEIFESEIDKLITDYNLDYPKLKSYFKIPTDTEFAFSFRTAEGQTRKPNYNAPTGSNVFANEVPILYVNNSVDIKSGFLNLIVW